MANTKGVMRPLVNFPEDLWCDRFLSLPFNNSEFESYTKQVEAMKETVKDMLVVSITDPIEKMHLVNSLSTKSSFITLPKLLDDNDYDLHIVALVFQIFRFNGYKLPCGLFSKFQDGDASHFRTNGEAILDEALDFTTKHLRSLANQSSTSPHLREYIENALFRPYHHSMQRLEAKLYISFYEKDESRNDILLNFAKYDFNRVQLLLQQELTVLSRTQDLKSKFPYARHRVVEGLFYALGVYFEPRYAAGRNMLVKQTCLVCFIDDAYEAYGLYEELRYFTDAIERFDISSMDELPTANQKKLYDTLLHVIGEAEYLVQKEGRSYAIPYTKDEWKKYVKAEQIECRRKHEKDVPTFDEYMVTGVYTCAARLAMTQILIGMEEADQNAFHWILNSNNKFLKALQICSRLYNDIVTNEDEEKRGFKTASMCYMKQYNVSRKEAIEAFRAKIGDAWKDINEGCMRPTMGVPMQVLRATLNYQRLLDLAYRDNDGYTKPDISFQQLITKLLIQPIPLD
ncbi:hypothetical protein ES332_D05G088500v1 [Gossypium tomentosum]|uniref:Uncharacterized protein n=1 Tax=Gossypium tomentosum TaxID=34277 RepID=A0A5D2KTE4_GOSTO|nr:hypothetical protein ES332_D05G088500v1 [Gossypium tomentosum]